MNKKRIAAGVFCVLLAAIFVFGTVSCVSKMNSKDNLSAKNNSVSEFADDENTTEYNSNNIKNIETQKYTESESDENQESAKETVNTEDVNETSNEITKDTVKETVKTTVGETSKETVKQTEKETTEKSHSERVQDILNSMSLEEKVYQMFIVTPEALTKESTVTTAGALAKSALEKYPVGGIVYFAKNLINTSQTKQMLGNMQDYAQDTQGLPLFLCVDEEGGRIARIANNSAFGVTNVGNMSNISTVSAARNAGVVIGSYLSALGFNFDFAPDADVLTNSNNTVIGNRSFGSDAKLVAKLAAAVSDGLHSKGIMSTFKHFPGHGATEGDTHDGFAYTNKTYAQLLENELVPFAAAQSSGVDAVMVAHISVPSVLGDNTPCSLSYKMVTEILRNELGFSGLIVTDALDMGAIVNSYGASEAAVMAVKAGNDLLLMPQDFEAAANAVINAVKSGEISESRINQSVYRIISAKLKL